MDAWDLLVDRTDLLLTTLVERETPEIADGQVLLRLSRVGLTMNNVTYAAFGDALRYWQFFPTGVDGKGRCPLWGFADVVASKAPGLEVGERVFGYLPTSSHLVVTPGRVSPAGFRDDAPHRVDLMKVYNDYVRVAADPSYTVEGEDLQALYRPLFMTSFVLEDFLASNDWFGAAQLVISSASSKTAYGAAHLAHVRGGVEVVGLTSAGNVDFTTALGCYDKVLTYEDAKTLATATTVYADVAGDPGLRRILHEHLGEHLVHDAVVGASHLDAPVGDDPLAAVLPGVKPAWFFAFDHLRTRAADWGPAGIAERYATAWDGFKTLLPERVEVVQGHGPRALEAAWAEVAGGKVDPKRANVLVF